MYGQQDIFDKKDYFEKQNDFSGLTSWNRSFTVSNYNQEAFEAFLLFLRVVRVKMGNCFFVLDFDQIKTLINELFTHIWKLKIKIITQGM